MIAAAFLRRVAADAAVEADRLDPARTFEGGEILRLLDAIRRDADHALALIEQGATK